MIYLHSFSGRQTWSTVSRTWGLRHLSDTCGRVNRVKPSSEQAQGWGSSQPGNNRSWWEWYDIVDIVYQVTWIRFDSADDCSYDHRKHKHFIHTGWPQDLPHPWTVFFLSAGGDTTHRLRQAGWLSSSRRHHQRPTTHGDSTAQVTITGVAGCAQAWGRVRFAAHLPRALPTRSSLGAKRTGAGVRQASREHHLYLLHLARKCTRKLASCSRSSWSLSLITPGAAPRREREKDRLAGLTHTWVQSKSTPGAAGGKTVDLCPLNPVLQVEKRVTKSFPVQDGEANFFELVDLQEVIFPKHLSPPCQSHLYLFIARP